MPEVEAAPETPRQAQAPSARIRRFVWWLGFGTSALVAGSLSLLAYAEGIPTTLDGVPQIDKGLHFGIGGMLAFFLDGVLRRRMLRVLSISLPLAAVVILVPAAIEELLQRFSPNRSSSFADFAADLTGVAVGVWISRRVAR
jgi:VanZ family protein